MATQLNGLVQGSTVVLDEAVPVLDGKRVLVLLEPVDEAVLDRERNLKAWHAWIASGPQGPVQDDGEPELL